MDRAEFGTLMIEIVDRVQDDFPEQASILNVLGMATIVHADIVITMMCKEASELSRALTLALFQVHPEFLDGFRAFLDERGAEYTEEALRKFAGVAPEETEDADHGVFKDFIDSLGG